MTDATTAGPGGRPGPATSHPEPLFVVRGSCTATDAFDALAAEGYPLDDVRAAMDALISEGLELQQGDKGWILTAAELARLRTWVRDLPAGSGQGVVE
mgnify:FL=1